MGLLNSYGTGYHVDEPDLRDYRFDHLAIGGLCAPGQASIAQHVREVHDQSWSESCVAQAIESAYAIRRRVLAQDYDPLSRRYLWFNARAYLGVQRKNVGVVPRLALRGFQKLGGSLETACPFSPLAFFVRPSWKSYSVGYKNRGAEYRRIDADRAVAVREAVHLGIPVIAGLSIGKSFKRHEGVLYLEPPTEVVARHMVTIVGYDESGFSILNSWGRQWARGGVGRITTHYLESEAAHDLYAIL